MKNILVTGAPRVGKTTLVRRVLLALKAEVGGFYTQELREGRKRVGFELITLSGGRGVMAHEEIRRGPRVGKYGVDLRVLEGLGVGEVRRAVETCQLVVIDEIGKMELYSSQFQEAVLCALDSKIPVLATIGMGGSQFADLIRRRDDVELHILEVENRDLLFGQILSRLGEELSLGA